MHKKLFSIVLGTALGLLFSPAALATLRSSRRLAQTLRRSHPPVMRFERQWEAERLPARTARLAA